MKITSGLLKSLRFERVDVSAEESGEDAYYFWTNDLSESNRSFCLLTNSSDEIQDDVWTVYLLEVDDYVITDGEILTEFLAVLRKVKDASYTK